MVKCTKRQVKKVNHNVAFMKGNRNIIYKSQAALMVQSLLKPDWPDDKIALAHKNSLSRQFKRHTSTLDSVDHIDWICADCKVV